MKIGDKITAQITEGRKGVKIFEVMVEEITKDKIFLRLPEGDVTEVDKPDFKRMGVNGILRVLRRLNCVEVRRLIVCLNKDFSLSFWTTKKNSL